MPNYVASRCSHAVTDMPRGGRWSSHPEDPGARDGPNCRLEPQRWTTGRYPPATAFSPRQVHHAIARASVVHDAGRNRAHHGGFDTVEYQPADPVAGVGPNRAQAWSAAFRPPPEPAATEQIRQALPGPRVASIE